MSDKSTSRRNVLGLLAGVGAGGLVASQVKAQQDTLISTDTLAEAERVMAVSYTPSEREQMLNGIDAWVSRVERLRAMEKPNGLAPALTFDPRLPGQTFRSQTSGVQGIQSDAGSLPSNSSDIAFAPVWKLAAWMSQGQLSSIELTELYLERIAQYGPQLECYVTVTADLARRQAAERDGERARGQVRGPLHGIPYALKDIIDVAGIRASWGATVYKDRIAEETAIVAERLEAAGAVLLGKSTSGAIAYGDIWYDGVTRNPFNTKEGSSGSSAGSASATAAALCAFAIGTETLGSIVSPSHRCGTTGLRPTFGRVPRTGAMALCWSLDKIGPIVRSVSDAAIVLEAINGADAGDPSSLDHGFEVDFSRDLSGLKLGYNASWFEGGAEPDRAALNVARSLGVELVPIEIEDAPYAAMLIQLECEAAAAFEEITLENLDDQLRWQSDAAWPNTFRRARFASAVDMVNADRLRRKAMQTMAEVFEGVDAIIGPNFASGMLTLTNFTGHPQLAFRSGFLDLPTRPAFGGVEDSSGQTHSVPYASSLWAPLFEEGTLLSLGAQIEARLGVADTQPQAFT